MLPANKHMDPVVGLDIHITMIPTPAGPVPIPIPYPFIGMVMDPMDYIPVIGATTMVNKVPRGNSTTAGMLGTVVHIPMGGPFMMAPVIGHDSTNFFGSSRVVTEGSYTSASGFMVMSCNDIGMPLTLAPGKKMKPKPSFYLPSSATIPIPTGPPVIVGGPYVPDLMAMLMNLAMSYGFGALMKGAGKALKKLNHAVLKKFPATQGLSKKLCKMGFEPVDLITGRMMYEGEDFQIPGVIPISWQRNWYSDSAYDGILGHGVHCNYDIALHMEEAAQVIVMRLPDGRVTNFPFLIAEKDSFYDRSEKLTITCIDRNTYTVKDHSTSLTNTFKRISNDLFKPETLSNADGLSVQFLYDAGGKLEQVIDTAGRRINISSNSEGRIIEITAIHEGSTRFLVGYSYNTEGDLIGITDALSQTISMEYSNHLMVKKTDRNRQAFYWEYDGKETGAKCVKTWGDGGVLSGSIQYGKGQNMVTNSLGEETVYYFDRNNLCTQVTNAEGGHTFHEYTEFMEPYRDMDEEGNTLGFTYDGRGNLIGIHQPDDSVTTFIYDEKDRLILSKSPGGASNTRTYKNGKLHATINSDDAVTSFTYNNLGLIETIRDNVGNTSFLKYDTDNNISELTLPRTGITSWKYNAWGQSTNYINPEKHQQHFDYDKLGRVSKVKLADDNVVKLEYNAYDEVIKTVDSKKNLISFDYTPLGSLKMREQNGTQVHFKYNNEEQLLAIVNEHEESYRFGRNKKGEIINETGFDGLRRDYTRDRAGKVLEVRRPDNRFTKYEYDLNGRITRSEHSDSTWETHSYDKDGNLIEAVNQDTHVKIIRDETAHVISENQDGHIIENSFDALGNRISIESSLGANIKINRNEIGFVDQLTVTNSNSKDDNNSEPWTANMRYNSIGMELERQLPGGIVSKFSYDKAGRPIQQKVRKSNRETRKRTYAWNVNDQLRNIVDELSGGTTNFSYDAISNLASARYEDKQFDYKLPDEVGNLYKSKDQNDREYGPGSQLLMADGNSFKYDGEGNLITKITSHGNWKYTWYGNRMLESVRKPDGDVISYEYDALGRRTAKIVKPKMPHKKGVITRWVWNGDVPLHEWSYDLDRRPQLLVDEFGMLAESEPEPVENLITWVFDEGSFKPVAKIVDGEQYSIITDYLGTPVEMYNSKGQKTWEVDYNIYGKIRKQVKGVASDCPFRYQGQYEDQETGLYYNRFRYYAPDEGIYISQDPIRLKSRNINFYAYTKDINIWIDLFGLTGTYIFTDGTTSYIGKGPNKRMKASMNQRIAGSPNSTASTHVDFGDSDMGYMVEHKLMEDYDARYSDDFANSDKLSSPGKKKYEAADATTKAKVDAEAAKIKADFEGQKTKVKVGC